MPYQRFRASVVVDVKPVVVAAIVVVERHGVVDVGVVSS